MSAAEATPSGGPGVLAPDVDAQFAALVAPLEDDLLDAELAALLELGDLAESGAMGGGRRPDDPAGPSPAGPPPPSGPVGGHTAGVPRADRARPLDAEPRGRERSPPRPDTDRA